MPAQHLEIWVKPNSAVSTLARDDSGRWVARLKSPPVDGRANAELIALVAHTLGCARGAVSIRSGGTGRRKLIRIAEE